jgi:hypothetical protein
MEAAVPIALSLGLSGLAAVLSTMPAMIFTCLGRWKERVCLPSLLYF